jgi:predicted nucleotide-binding protein
VPSYLAVDQEFIVHLFAPLDGPQAARAYEQVRCIWAACRDQFGMSGRDAAGLPGAALPSLQAIGNSGRDSVLAFQEGAAGIRQAVLRRSHDVLNLSVALAQPVSEGRPPRRLGMIRPADGLPPRPNWKDYAALWARASQPRADALLGEAHVYLARTQPRKTGSVQASAGLGGILAPLLPYREDRSPGWHWRGISTTAGYALWDTEVAGTGAVREIVLAAAADRDEELSAWAWSDRTPAMPPFARYLMHGAKLRYAARLLETWHGTAAADVDADSLITDLNAVLAPERPDGEIAVKLGPLRTQLRAEERRLTLLDGDMARLEQTVSVARRNLAAQPGCGPADGPGGMFAADQSLARYIGDQVSSDRRYLQIKLSRVRSMLELATAELAGRGAVRAQPSTSDGAPETPADVARRVFVVYGRDGTLIRRFFDLLYVVGLQPLEWEKLVALTGTTVPYLGDAVSMAPHLAQANLVLLSPDDIVELHPGLHQPGDQAHERARAGQSRPNVLFELGLAYATAPKRTIIVEIGQLRPIADLAGLNVIHFDGSAEAIKKIIDRLALAGCPADTSGEHWLDTSRFAGLEAYRRGPGTGEQPRDRES